MSSAPYRTTLGTTGRKRIPSNARTKLRALTHNDGDWKWAWKRYLGKIMNPRFPPIQVTLPWDHAYRTTKRGAGEGIPAPLCSNGHPG